ncbi:UBX-domain-containing protein [Xylona heveae TC161]|uniref:UBX-domain-containing protein n=1 Tax=Xylona heveae (strain CBS 132557 / TC161) TaxID=1328760 RepID=A0A164ZYX6_XYLHT|nr:UBX-domain-containing protein [Xylona heveae TC161]KZF19721.1 UBX-domain-containing protein [Xylona heveae TC161]
MAGTEFDIAQLNEDQQLALQQFTSVTDQEVEAAIPILQRSQWNVQIAIAKFFDGESADPVEEAIAASPQQHTARETLINGSGSFPRSAVPHGLDPAPRIVPQPESQVSYRPPVFLSLLFAPFSLLYRFISTSFGLFGYLFPFLPRLLSRLSPATTQPARLRDTTGRRPLNARDTAARFAREFEEEYGAHSLPFVENGYAQSFDMAKKDLKFLLVILLSPEHDETASFVRNTLLAPEVVEYINDPRNNIILWGGSVQDSEPYQVSAALNCTKFPFAALISHTPQLSSTAMSIIARITGPTPPTAFVAKLREAISQHSQALNQARATRAEQQAARNLREEQNSAYERSLAQDRERARQRREAEAARERAEREAREKAEAEERKARNVQLWRQHRAKTIPPEPAANAKDVARISIRMPSGDRVIRKFSSDATIEELYAFVECYDVLQGAPDETEEKPDASYRHEFGFKLVSPMPRTVYDISEGGTIRARVGPSANLIVEEIVDDEDEDATED